MELFGEHRDLESKETSGRGGSRQGRSKSMSSSRMRKTGKMSKKRRVTSRKTSPRRRKTIAAIPSGTMPPASRSEPPPIIPQPSLDLEEEEEEFPTDEGEQRQEPPPPSASLTPSPRGDADDCDGAGDPVEGDEGGAP